MDAAVMPQIPINFLAILAATAAAQALGFLWYGPLFGKQWLKLSGITQEKAESAKKKGMAHIFVLSIIGSLVMSWVLLHSLVFASDYLGMYGAAAGLQAGFWNWLGFVAPVTLGVVLWEGKSWTLWCINTSYYLVTLMVMGVILAVWM